jgi:hypothetical protein
MPRSARSWPRGGYNGLFSTYDPDRKGKYYMAKCEIQGCERDGKLWSARNVDKPNHELHADVCDQHWNPLQNYEQAHRLRKLTDDRTQSHRRTAAPKE